MTAPAALGIDVGTTNVKTAVVQAGTPVRVVARGSAAYATRRPRPGWAEQEPDDWWRAVRAALRQLGAALARVSTMAVSGQGSTFVLWHTQPIGAAITWQDLRAADEARRIDREYRVLLDEAHGNRVGDAPEPKLVWLRHERPQALARAQVVLGAAATVAARFGASAVLNEGDAGSWLSWDRHTRAWSPSIARTLGVTRLLPPVVPLASRIGAVAAPAARQTGVPDGIPIVASTTDVAAAALAAGVGEPGEVFYSKGTGGFVCCHVGPIRDPGPLLALPVGRDGVVQLCGATDTVGAAYDWCRELLGVTSHVDAERLAASACPGSAGLLFLPWLQGAQHPVLEPDARGIGFGFSLETRRGEFLRAILEGTALALREHLDAARRVANHDFATIVSSGGPTASNLWNRLDAAAAEARVHVAPESDAAVGSALVAGEAEGLWASALEEGRGLRKSSPIFDPDPELAAVARRLRAVGQKLASSALPLFRDLAPIRDARVGE